MKDFSVVKGVYPIAVTPFKDNGDLDLKSTERYLNFLMDLGVDGITILGLLGESNRLNGREKETFIAACAKTIQNRPGNEQIGLCVTVSSTATDTSIELAKTAQKLGATSLMLAPIRERVPNEKQIFEFYQDVATATSLPIVVQDHPAITNVHMTVDLITKLLNEIPTATCLKAEAPPTPVKIKAIKDKLRGEKKVTIMPALGALYSYFEFEVGVDGLMTGFAFPEVLQAMVAAANANDLDRLWQIYHYYLPLIVFEQQPGPATRKHVMKMRGLLESNAVRRPAKNFSPSTQPTLDKLFNRLLGDVDISKPIQVRTETVNH